MRRQSCDSEPAFALARRCHIAPEGSPCLMPEAPQSDQRCYVCANIVQWHKAGHPGVLVKEIRQGEASYVFPARDYRDREELAGCVLSMSFATHTQADIRDTVNTLASSTGEVWILADGRWSQRIR